MNTNATSNPADFFGRLRSDPGRRRGVARWPVMGLILATSLAAQGQVSPATEALRIYRQAYEAAMLDGTISAEERVLLEALQQAMGLHEDLIDEAVGEAVRPSVPRLNQGGRWTLVAQNMGWGIGLYGWGIPFVLGAEDSKWIVAGEMFSLGASLYLTWRYTEDVDLPEARSQMQRYGGVVGFHYGRALVRLIEVEGKLPVAMLMLAVPAGAYLWDRLYKRWMPSTGQAYALALHADLGRSIMSLVHRQIFGAEPLDYYYYDPYDGDYDASQQERESWQKLNTLFQVAGYPIGTYLSRRYYGNRQYSFGDALMLIIGRGTGAFYGFLLADLLDFDLFSSEATGWRWLTTAGAVGGVVGMDRYIRGVDYSFGQSAL
ncbi:MAG: hypothetical protein IH971_11145, partial [Candidatus Marinimicrobia bacterium]|nr:hypothetical protein [Candidatus Neomarinimicrobiota bacterium]